MVREKNAKISSLALGTIVLAIYFLCEDVADFGLIPDASILQRCSFHFFHASIWHVLINVWVLLSIVFVFNISLITIITAFVIASLFPIDTLSSILYGSSAFSLPTIGLSGVCYALLGQVAFMVKRRWYYQMWMAIYIGAGFLFPNVNGWIHLYCYLLGMAVALLNKPIK